MATVNVTVTNVRAYSNKDAIRYRVSFKEQIDAIVKKDDGTYAEGVVDYIDFVPRVLIAQAINYVDGLAYIYGKRKEQGLRNGDAAGFTAADLTLIVAGATFELERTKFSAGEEYVDADGEVAGTHDHDGYNTTITNVILSEKAQSRIDKVLEKALGL